MERSHHAKRTDTKSVKYRLHIRQAKGKRQEAKGRINNQFLITGFSITTEIKGLTTGVADQEFTNRGIFIVLIVAILGGAAKLFGFFPNP
ncbi:hypothetical protein [Microcystis aeruginosa]|uniref:hypothetical protein n=1 Tax=Microcystis aeruginosa TaxID=1126 RepID=UPI00232ECD12|nr:hypothetical protein [Microcystis aeruginosa]MDB9414433.1 hypothetical protein [Microcystis aeruginosa CS-567/02]